MKRRRVLFVVESGTDVRLVEGLAERFELELFCRKISDGVEISRPLRTPVFVEVGPASRMRFAVWVTWQLLRRKGSWDVLVVQGYALGALACNLMGRALRKPVVMLVCSPVERYYRCRKIPESQRTFRRHEYFGLWILARLNARLGQRYFVLSQHLRDVIRSHGSRRPIEIVPVYGVDLKTFAPSNNDRPDLCVAAGLPVGRSVVFFSSRIAPEKDAKTLLEAVRLLRDDGQTLLVVNRSGGFKEFERLAARIGIGDLVDAGNALDPEERLPALYRASNVCVQASREEGLGFSPLEALACGTPVIAAAVGGLLETIIDGETGWTYQPGDSRGLAAAIRSVLSNSLEAAARTSRGQAMIRERFERSKVFAAFEVALERAIEGAPPSNSSKATGYPPIGWAQ